MQIRGTVSTHTHIRLLQLRKHAWGHLTTNSARRQLIRDIILFPFSVLYAVYYSLLDEIFAKSGPRQMPLPNNRQAWLVNGPSRVCGKI